jgi:shikimate dehydrogenase
MRRSAVLLGHPVSHSLSPAIFHFLQSAAFKDLAPSRRPYFLEYRALDCPPEQLPKVIAELRQDHTLVGFNLTLPHKERILGELDEVSADARAVGAVNCVKIHEGRKLEGFNTDVLGLLQAWKVEGIELQGKHALVLGAGGAARAVLQALVRAGATEISVWNRNPARAASLCEDFQKLHPSLKFTFIRSPEDLMGPPPALLVQATSAGMTGGPSETENFEPWLERLAPEGIAYDLVYRPRLTPFLKAAQNRGLQAYGGLTMLIEQAIEAWILWLGDLPERDELRGRLVEFLRHRLHSDVNLSRIRARGPLVLVGMMGSGKSTIGRALAWSLGWDFIDLDERIEEVTHQTIAENFEKEGEPGFRELEAKVFESIPLQPAQVISLGGGAFCTESIRRRVLDQCQSIYLKASLQFLEKRLRCSGGKRPLLKSLSASERSAELQNLLSRREPLYQQANFTFQIDSDAAHASSPLSERDPRSIAQEVLKLLESRKTQSPPSLGETL